MRQLIAFSRVRARGNKLTRELVDSLRADQELAAQENSSLKGEVAALRGELAAVPKVGIKLGRRWVRGRILAVLLLAAGTWLWLWYDGVSTPAKLGPAQLVQPVINHFGIAPTSIDTAAGKTVTLTYVNGPYLQLSGDEKYDYAEAIARFVWTLPGRPTGAEMIKVMIASETDVILDFTKTQKYYFYPKQLNVAR